MTNVEENAVCSICLEPIGWIYPKLPHIGSMCIECANQWDEQNKDKEELKDPATTLTLPRCPYCKVILSTFIANYHFSRCSEAPSEIKQVFELVPENEKNEFIFREREKFTYFDKDSWKFWLTMQKQKYLWN